MELLDFIKGFIKSGLNALENKIIPSLSKIRHSTLHY